MTSKRILVSLCVFCMVLGAVTLVSAERPKPAEKVAAEGPGNVNVKYNGPAIKQLDEAIQTQPAKSRAAGTIQYDDGVATGTPTGDSHCWGNQFNSAMGSSVNASGSVTGVQFYMAAVTGNAFVSVYGPVAGATAAQLTSVSVPAAAGWNTHTFTAALNYTGSSFLAGVWYFGGDSVAVGTGTTGGQGLHGMHINDGAVGTGFTAPGTFNALVRASGNVLVPVELMSFSVE